MNKKNLIFALSAMLIMLTACNGNAQNKNKQTSRISTTETTTTIQVIQFHSEHRCYTCNLIEKLAREAVQNLPNVTFLLVNVDDCNNEKLAEEFEASGTALFIYNPKTKTKKDLTDSAFMNAKTKPEELKKHIVNAISQFGN